MKIYLLTHERELNRLTNTGSIAVQHASDIVERIVWQRLCPDKRLVQLIDTSQALLMHQERANSTVANINDYSNIILIDATWQESRKIINKSPYLKRAPLTALRATQQSRYTLRRNQVSDGLCTVECVIEVLKIKGETALAAKLESEFSAFNQR